MNNLYFACCDCKIYINAGYRWAYWELENAGVVSRRKEVSVESVLAADNYWHPPVNETCRWLYEDIFPQLKKFLNEHKSHRIVFGELEDFAPGDDDYFLEWMQIGFCLDPSPRYLVEVLGLRTWDQVDRYMTELDDLAPAWYQVTWSEDPSPREKGKRRFEEIVRQKNKS